MSSTTEPLMKRLKFDETGGNEKTRPQLCQDELVSILQWLPVKNLIQLERVCHQWKEVVIPRSFAKANRKSFDLDDYVKSWMPWRSANGSIDEFYIFKSLLDRMGLHLTSMVLKHLAWSRNIVPELLQLLIVKCPNLKHLDTSCIQLQSDWLSIMPPTIDSVRMDTAEPQTADLVEFIRSHPGLQKFWMSAEGYSIRDVPTLLAQHCTGLTHLSLFAYGGGQRHTSNFADVFPSLIHLKQFEVSMPNSFTSDDLESLCANCPNLGFLMLSQMETVKIVDVKPILQLKKLTRLGLRKLDLTDQSVAALREGVGATLEHLQLRPNYLSDVSLRSIGYNCPNLTDLRFYFGRDSQLTQDGIAQLIATIMSHPGRSDTSNKRQLSVASMQQNLLDQIHVDQYSGRVVLITSAMGFACGGAPGFYHTDDCTVANSHMIQLVRLGELPS